MWPRSIRSTFHNEVQIVCQKLAISDVSKFEGDLAVVILNSASFKEAISSFCEVP